MRILFITWTRIGDAVLSTGILSYLLEANPGARVTVACGPLAEPLFRAVPGLDRVIPIAKRPYNAHWAALWRECIRTHWDLVVDLRASAVTWLVRADRRIVNRPARRRHKVVHLAGLLRIDRVPAPRLWLPADAIRSAQALLPSGPILALGPTASWRGKEWPLDRFVELYRRLTAADGLLPGAAIAVLGGPQERSSLQPLMDTVPTPRLVDLVGRADVLTAAACLARCALFIGNDSGPMHLAAAAGLPTLGLFGPTSEEEYGPWGPHCAAVRTRATVAELPTRAEFERTGGATLMNGLSVAAVDVAARQLWARVQSGRG